MQPLQGKRIAIAGPRRATELAALITKLGGIPLVRPAQGTVVLAPDEVAPAIRRLAEQGADWVVLTTGMGLDALEQQARALGLWDAVLAQLRRARLAVRGYKTARAAKVCGLEPAVRDDDGTLAGLMRALEPLDLAGARVAVQLYGEPSEPLAAFLARKRAAEVYELLPYRHLPPPAEALESLVSDVVAGRVDAVAFTSAPQVRFLFAHARETGRLSALQRAFREGVVAAAVGRVTAQALRDEGVERLVAPQHERMGAMVMALAEHWTKPDS